MAMRAATVGSSSGTDPFTREEAAHVAEIARFASLLLQAGEPITYVSSQMGHKDSAITLRVYAHWLPDSTSRKGVDRLDEYPAVAHSLHTAVTLPLRRTA